MKKWECPWTQVIKDAYVEIEGEKREWVTKDNRQGEKERKEITLKRRKKNKLLFIQQIGQRFGK